ncbi:MAG: hypothetical protein A2017_06855 [Lentisphaerae bacterium GWF2_44_16]|nr:MAG: hypothetical protein A2017_06855 [Lentisphaerae bacterium GWF2_44_16]
MYNNKMKKILNTISPPEIDPEVRVSNYIDVKAGVYWGPREINDFELIYIASGFFSFRAGNKNILLEEGQALCIYPGETHILKCEKDSAYGASIACIHLEPVKGYSWLKGDYKLKTLPSVFTDIQADPLIHGLFRNCAAAFSGYGKYRNEIVRTMVKEIWLRFSEYWEGGSGKQFSPRVNMMLSYLRKSIHENITRRDLAEKFSLTPEYVNFIFKKELGITPTEFTHREKIFQAYRYLSEDGLSVKETAQKLAFYDEFYFSRIFKRIMKQPPGRISARRKK